MLLKDSKHVLQLAAMLILYAATSSYASVANADSWKNFGDKTLYFLGSNRCPMPSWLRRQKQMVPAFAEPDSAQAVLALQSFLEQAFEGYEQESFVWQGRISLDKNPYCILGLYLAERFSGTELANEAKRQFERCIERSCLAAFGADIPWKQRLETELTEICKDSKSSFGFEFFDEAEAPFLLIYFTENGGSEEVRQQARKQLAQNLLERYALESTLMQYRLLLLGQTYTDVSEHRQLQVARLFEQTGAVFDAKELYEKIFENTNMAEIATTTAENLARIKLANSQERQAWHILNALYKRFPDTRLSNEDLKSFFLNFQTDRAKKLEQLVGELLTTQKEEEILKLCRVCSNLWTEEEAPNRLQYIIDKAEPEGIASQVAQLYLAQNLVHEGKVNKANDLLESLFSSVYPTIRAEAILVSADIAERINNMPEALSLYQQAAQIERPTILPQWFKTYQVKQVNIEKLTAGELNFFGSFLRGYSELIQGNFAAALHLLEVKESANKPSSKSLVYDAKKTIPPMLALAYLKMDDYARAEQHGLQAIRALVEDGQGSAQFRMYPSQIERVDEVLFVLSGQLRSSQKRGSESHLERYAKKVYATVTAQGPFDTDFGLTKSGMVQLFWQIKRQHVARILSGEYDLAKTRLLQGGNSKELLELEPIIFTAQLLQEDSFEQIRRAVAAATPQDDAMGQMYRFARFARQINQPYMARMALNAATQEIGGVDGNVQLLENIADMYLAGNDHQKAIEIYERIVEQASNESEAEKAQFKVIKVYAEQLGLHDKAIQECQKFLKKFANSQQISQVEFLIGKLAYLAKDYAGATGQLNLFQKKFPDSPQIGQAMMLAALSRMSDGNTQDAIERFTEIIQKYPKADLAAHSKFLIGYAQVSEQKYSQALETFRQLIEQFPESKYTEQAQSFIDRLSRVSQ